MHCKSYSHFFSKKFQHIYVSLDVNFNASLTSDVVSFEQLGPDFFISVICGAILNASSGEIRAVDRNNDGLYDHMLDCHWTILSQPNQLIRLNILSIQLEDSIGCIFDYLEVGS